jgi:HlyD family secretion protein
MRRIIIPLVSFVLTLSLAASGQSAPKSKSAGAKGESQTKLASKKAESPKPEEASKGPEAAKPAEKPSDPEGATHTVVKGPFKIEITLDGRFAARQMAEVMVRTKGWTDLEVVQGVPHGAKVKKGDVLVTLNLQKIDEAMAEAQNEVRLAEIGVKLAEADLRALEGVMPLDVAAMNRAHQQSGEDYDRYQKVDVPLARKSADFMLKMVHEYLENEKEEFRQLEKMYKADDITEETEEIVLKRQRSAVERAEFMVERAKLEYEEMLKIQLPRQQESRKDAVKVEDLRYERAKVGVPLGMDKVRAELDKARLLRGKAEEKLKNLRADREAMNVKSPADGTVYYGRSTAGKFSGSDGEPLRRGDTIPANKVFLTVLQVRPVSVCADVPEDKLYAVRPGLKGTVTPKGFPDLKATGVVAEVGAIPVGEGRFPARLDVSMDQKADAVMPGMSCSVKFTPYAVREAVTVPKAAVQTDEWDEQQRFVYLVKDKQEPRKQPVTVGKQNDRQAEILKGLSPGDKILLEPPKKK